MMIKSRVMFHEETTTPSTKCTMEEAELTAAESSSESTTSTEAPLPMIEEEERMRRTMWQTTVRESLLPFLPPPVTRGIHTLDAALSVYVGPEPTISLTVTILVAWFTVALLQRCLSRRSGRAIKTVDDDPLLSSREERFDATVLLIGPRNAGKTRLFYQICHAEPNMPTVASLKPNVGVASLPIAHAADPSRLRVMDWPGHAPLSEALAALQTTGKSNTPLRLMLVLDATQPVAPAAEFLWELLLYLHAPPRRSHATPRLSVLVACHKKDLPKAKNDKRIKIQLRTELERRLSHAAPEWWPPHQSVDLDELPLVPLLCFATTTCHDATLSVEVMEFCRTGTITPAGSTAS
jgi:signal recognition particle receptor subunit beta